jgi:hypothetical protein
MERRVESALVDAYLHVLARHRTVIGWGVPAPELPASSEEIRAAIIGCVQPDSPRATRQNLRDAYSSLAWFTTAEDVERLRAAKRVLDSSDWSPAGKATYVAAHARRQEILQEATRLGREFDAAVPPWLPPAQRERDQGAAPAGEEDAPSPAAEEPTSR